jgi:hypothetical protein
MLHDSTSLSFSSVWAALAKLCVQSRREQGRTRCPEPRVREDKDMFWEPLEATGSKSSPRCLWGKGRKALTPTEGHRGALGVGLPAL